MNIHANTWRCGQPHGQHDNETDEHRNGWAYKHTTKINNQQTQTQKHIHAQTNNHIYKQHTNKHTHITTQNTTKYTTGDNH